MSRKKLRKALKDPNTVHQVRLRDGRVVEWTGNDDSRHCCIWPKGAAAGSRVEPFPVQTAVGSAQKQSILASPMAFRGSGGGRRFE